MDTFLVTKNDDGSVTVNTRGITLGGEPPNPTRALPYSG